MSRHHFPTTVRNEGCHPQELKLYVKWRLISKFISLNNLIFNLRRKYRATLSTKKLLPQKNAEVAKGKQEKATLQGIQWIQRGSNGVCVMMLYAAGCSWVELSNMGITQKERQLSLLNHSLLRESSSYFSLIKPDIFVFFSSTIGLGLSTFSK